MEMRKMSPTNDHDSQINTRDGSGGTVPLTMIAGWLGAGKTTIVNKLMTNMIAAGLKIAFIQNEFSQGGMDKPSLTDKETGQVFDNFLELAEGCICCSVKNDFVNALDKLLSMRRFDYIILECSGLADPGEVASTLWVDEDLQLGVHLDSVITVLDGHYLPKQLSCASAEESSCLQRQIAMADRLIISKVDLIDTNVFDSLCDRIRQINAIADVVPSIQGDIDYQQIVNLNAYSTRNESSFLSMKSSSCSHDHSIGAVVLGPYTDLSIDLQLLDRWLADILWDILESEPKYLFTIFRLKGVIYNSELNRRVHIQAVQQLFDREIGNEWKLGEDKATKVVIIGRHLDKTILEEGLFKCAIRNTKQPVCF